MARNISAASVFPDLITSSKACSACGPPMPCILEGFDLGLRLFTSGCFEQDVIGGLRIEWRVEINEIGAIAGDVVP